MSYYNDYIVNSNNSINDNIYNMEKLKKSSKYKIKKVLKPLMRMLSTNKKSKTNKCACKNSSIDSSDMDYSSEIYDNQSNETLETRIIDEIKNCGENKAMYICNSENGYDLTPVVSDQVFVPVHFARVPGKGTFFWTSVKSDCDLEEYKQQPHLPNLQYHLYDRWVQA